jgi:phage FluMu protein Com
MAIYFSCRQCGKALFAQDQYAGRAVKCPGCQSENTIPAPRGGVPVPSASAEEKGDPELMDMEQPLAQAGDKRPAADLPGSALGVPHSGADVSPHSEPQPAERPGGSELATPAAQSAEPLVGTSLLPEATRRCPMCAETIKAAAKKCRFCGTLLDEELKAEQTRQIEKQALSGFVGEAERSAHTWRVLAMAVTTITAGWLVMLTMMTWHRMPPTLAVFNLLLAAGLVWNTTQMKRGPASVFLAAAAAVLFCMPIDTILGLALVDEATLRQIKSQDPQQYANLTTEQVNAAFGLMFTFVGLLFSVPVWIATVKVALFQRLNTTREKDRG